MLRVSDGPVIISLNFPDLHRLPPHGHCTGHGLTELCSLPSALGLGLGFNRVHSLSLRSVGCTMWVHPEQQQVTSNWRELQPEAGHQDGLGRSGEQKESGSLKNHKQQYSHSPQHSKRRGNRTSGKAGTQEAEQDERRIFSREETAFKCGCWKETDFRKNLNGLLNKLGTDGLRCNTTWCNTTEGRTFFTYWRT